MEVISYSFRVSFMHTFSFLSRVLHISILLPLKEKKITSIVEQKNSFFSGYQAEDKVQVPLVGWKQRKWPCQVTPAGVWVRSRGRETRVEHPRAGTFVQFSPRLYTPAKDVQKVRGKSRDLNPLGIWKSFPTNPPLQLKKKTKTFSQTFLINSFCSAFICSGHLKKN